MRDDELTRLLRRSAPDVRPRDEHRRQLRAQLEHNFRYHRRRRRLPAAAAAVLAAFGLLAGWTVPLGSDSFVLVAAGRPDISSGSLVKDSANHKVLVNRTRDEAGLAALELHEREIAEGRYTIVSVIGYEVAGKSYREFFVHADSDPPGATSNIVTGHQAPAQAEVMAILQPVLRQIVACIGSDAWTSTTSAEETIEGIRFHVTIKAKVFPEVGEVRLVTGDRIP